MRTGSRIALGLAGLLLAAGGFWLGSQRGAAPRAAAEQAIYHCPMHPQIVSDRPGVCPICSMTLVRRDAAPPPGGRRVLYYRNPMDPSIRSETPAKDSMGMDFVPVYSEETEAASSVAGRATVALSQERRQMLGVRSQAVAAAPLSRTIRTVGRVTVDERLLQHVHVKYDGYVEALYVDFTGKFVKRGDPLLSIYSPDLVATQQEYLLAWRAQRQLSAAPAAVAQGGQGLLEAARQRLLFWDIRPSDIEKLERTGEVMRALDIHAEHGGYVVQKTAFHGMRVTPADTLYDIADLSQLWVLADVYESDLPSVRLGMAAELSVPYLPDRRWHGAVTYVAPTVEEKTRTIKVRVEVDNADAALKPDMFADVFLSTDLGSGLVVPESAVINAGDRKLVFVDRADGFLEPREVQLGVRVGNGYELLAGVREGERVVTSANFLLDSESSLKAALAAIAPTVTPAPTAHTH
jgi:multidrug efflux pump subunit AcrA (membrane-fusion protein)